MNKNWNDRADKDLFFTILSVKNIGVISGTEWTTIGNHMRSLGYGFTNEGCRYVRFYLGAAGHLFACLNYSFALYSRRMLPYHHHRLRDSARKRLVHVGLGSL